jgi:hypothetical protein
MENEELLKNSWFYEFIPMDLKKRGDQRGLVPFVNPFIPE